MTQPGKSIKVERSVVTGIRIDGDNLILEGVDQDKEGNTLRHHQLNIGVDDRTGNINEAIAAIRRLAQLEIDQA